MEPAVGAIRPVGGKLMGTGGAHCNGRLRIVNSLRLRRLHISQTGSPLIFLLQNRQRLLSVLTADLYNKLRPSAAPTPAAVILYQFRRHTRPGKNISMPLHIKKAAFSQGNQGITFFDAGRSSLLSFQVTILSLHLFTTEKVDPASGTL